MARTTKEEAQKTRQRIMDTAISLFYSDGVSATTLEHIAEAASLTRGAIYWHFKNKTDLVTAIHDQMHLTIVEAMYRDLKNSDHSPLVRLQNASTGFLLNLAIDDMQQKVMTIFNLKCDYSGEMAIFLARQEQNKQQGAALFVSTFQEAIDRNDIKGPWSAEFLSRAHLYYLVGIITEYAQGKRLPDLRHDAEALMDFYFAKLN